MTVVPFHVDCRQDRRSLEKFLHQCYRSAVQVGHAQIASLSLPIAAVDPLLALEVLGTSEGDGIYLEHPARQEAMAAFGTSLYHESGGAERCRQAHRFMRQWSAHWQHGLPESTQVSQSQARFFCSFTFFDTCQDGIAPARVFLPTWQVSRQQQRSWLTANLIITPDVSLEDLAQRISDRLDQLAHLSRTVRPLRITALDMETGPAIAFHQAVSQALEHISRQQLLKIVVAHAADVVAPQPFSVFKALRSLRQQYPHCHIFSVADGQGGTFLGASPERLLSLHHHRLVTDALAGSAARGNTAAADAALAEKLLLSVKERDEHQFVVDFLLKTLTQLGLKPSYRPTPTILRLSNIQHLHTPIRTIVSPKIHPLQLVEALHPTPAVAGVPAQAACQYIRASESFDRGLYAAPFGWVDAQGNSEFIVGIRSALIKHNRARLYAGAGIVAGSNPTQELAEVQLKLEVLREVLG